MSLPNTTLWGDILPGGPTDDTASVGIDTGQVLDELLPSLHAANRTELTFWTEANLIEWMDEALKRLAVKAMVFVGRSATTLTAPAQATYGNPLRHISTLHVSVDARPLVPGNTTELEARDEDFETTAGDPDHWYQDLLGQETIGLTPVPEEEELLAVIYEGWPAALDPGKQQTFVAGPAPLKGYLAMCVLREAYGREGESEMPDVAMHCAARAQMYEDIFTRYYGPGL